MECKRYKASVTVFLSMMMVLLMGLVMCLVEVTKVHNMKAYRRVWSEGAIESVFAEYHMELREHYGLFGLDASYRRGDFSQNNVLERFSFYGGPGDESTIEGLQLLTDNQGMAFLDQVIFYMMDTTGLSYFQDMLDLATQWETINMDEGSKGGDSLADLGSLKDVVADNEEVDNPLGELLDLDFDGILKLVVEDKEALSDGSVDPTILCSHRQLEVGYGASTSLNSGAVSSKLMMTEYAMCVLDNASTHQGTAMEGTSNEDTLAYQLEYLIGGKYSDRDNLKAVVHKLLLLRTPVNYAYLQGDNVKKLEINVLATSIAVATAKVGMESIIAESLLWAWSYAESIADVKSLLSGHSLSLIKSEDQWQLELSNLLTLGNSNLPTKDLDGAMDYKDYLRILLYLESIDTLTKRTMDMVELDIRSMDGMEQFHLDYCISRLKVQVDTQVGMGYSYSFPMEFGYR